MLGRHQAEHTPKQLGEIFPKQILRKDALTELPTRPKPTGRLIAEDYVRPGTNRFPRQNASDWKQFRDILEYQSACPVSTGERPHRVGPRAGVDSDHGRVRESTSYVPQYYHSWTSEGPSTK